MEIVKNNIVSIILGVIALIALTTPFWLINGYVSDLQEKGNQSRQTYNNITALLNRQRVMPAPTPQGQPQPLDRFPNEALITAGENLRTDVQQTAQRMLDLAIEMNRRELLIKDSLPTPRGNDPFIFRDRYNDYVKPQMLSRDILHGAMPPTPEEIKLAQERLWEEVFVRQIRPLGGGKTNEEQVKQKYLQEAANVGNQMTIERAQQIKIYVEPNAFTWHPAFETTTGQPPTVEEMWFAQLGIWIQTTVAEALADTNADASNVLDSIVKHLIRIEFPDNPYVLPAAAGSSVSSAGTYPGEAPMVQTTSQDPTQPLPQAFDRSLTGRVSNALFDVVHLRVEVIVDATRFPIFLQKLGEERFLYVRTYRMESVDAAAQQLAGYVYGSNPVIRADLELEMLFFRDWTVDLMPDQVRVMLGIEPRRPVPGMDSGTGYPGGTPYGDPDAPMY